MQNAERERERMSSSWKEKVADRLSRLLADSSSHRNAAVAAAAGESPYAPGAAAQQATISSTEDLASAKKSPFTLFLLSLIPSMGSDVEARKSETPSTPYKRPSPLSSPPGRWKPNGISWKDRPPDSGTESETDEPIEFSIGNNYASERNMVTAVIEEAVSSGEHVACLSDKSALISTNLFEFLQLCLPNIVKGCQWVLLYSTLRHGISLRTLIRQSANFPGYCLLIVEDTQGAVFGGLLDSPLKPIAKRKYQGTNQTFVFTTKYGDPRLFRATGANRYYYMCLNDLLAFGGGGSFALRLDEDLLHGSSGPCETFGNLCLAYSQDFEIKNAELWGFAHLSRYL